MSPLSFFTLLERFAELVDELELRSFGAIPRAERHLEIEQVGPQFKLRFDLPAQNIERLELFLAQRAGHLVEHAQRAKRVTLRRDERRPRVEADAVFGHDERVVPEGRIVTRVGDDHQVALWNCVRAERDASRCLRDRDPDARLEPLPVGVNQADERDGSSADVRGEERQVVERALGLGIEDAIPSQGCQPSWFVRDHVGAHSRPVRASASGGECQRPGRQRVAADRRDPVQ